MTGDHTARKAKNIYCLAFTEKFFNRQIFIEKILTLEDVMVMWDVKVHSSKSFASFRGIRI